LKTVDEEQRITTTPEETEPDERLIGLPARAGQGTGVSLADGLRAGAATVRSARRNNN